jgi:hypothetical protein
MSIIARFDSSFSFSEIRAGMNLLGLKVIFQIAFTGVPAIAAGSHLHLPGFFHPLSNSDIHHRQPL